MATSSKLAGSMAAACSGVVFGGAARRSLVVRRLGRPTIEKDKRLSQHWLGYKSPHPMLIYLVIDAGYGVRSIVGKLPSPACRVVSA